MDPRMLRSIIAVAVLLGGVACANALHISRHQSSDLAQEALQKGPALAPADHRFLVVQATTAAPNTTLVAPESVLTQAVCVEMVIPLVGEWVLLDLGAGLSLTNKSDGTVILEGFLAVGVSLDLVLVTLQIGIKGTLAINLQLPASVPAEPLAITQWAVKTIIYGMIEKSKFAAGLLNSPKKSYYIDQVYKGVQKAADKAAENGTPVSNQVLSDTFAEMFHNYVNTMQYHCPHEAGIYGLKSYCQASTTVSKRSTTTIYAQDHGFEEVGSGEDEYYIPKHSILGGKHWKMGGVNGPAQCKNTEYHWWANAFEPKEGTDPYPYRFCNMHVKYKGIQYNQDCGIMYIPANDPRRVGGEGPNGVNTHCSCQGTAHSSHEYTNGEASGASSCNKPTPTDWAWMIPTLDKAIAACGKQPHSGKVGTYGRGCYAFSWNPDSWSYFYGQSGPSTFDIKTHKTRNNEENFLGPNYGRGWTSYVRTKQFSQMDTDSQYEVLDGTRISSMQIGAYGGAPYWPSGISLTEAESLCGDEPSCLAFSWNPQDATVFYSNLNADGKMTQFADMTTAGTKGNGKGKVWHDGSSNPPGWTNYNSAKGSKSTKNSTGLGDFWAVSADARTFAIAKAGEIATSTDTLNADYMQPACDITSDKCLKAFQNFLLAHFSLNFFGLSFNFNNGNWLNTPALNCDKDLDPSYYFNTLRVNRIQHPGVTLESVTQAGIRLCQFIASGVLLPDPKDQDSDFDYDKHKDSNMLNMLILLMPSLFPDHQDNSIFVTNTVFQDRESIGKQIKSLGKGGGMLSTFHHIMGILSGTPKQVKATLTKFVKARAKKADAKKQSCGAGIKSVTGAVAVSVSVGAKSGGGFCASTEPEISVGAVVSASIAASLTKPCALSKWSKASAAFTFKVQLPTIKVPFTKISMSIGVTGYIGLNGDSKFSLKFLELIPKAKEDEKPATPPPEDSPLVAALKAGFATAKPELQPLIQTIADVADYHNSQRKTKADLVSLIMTDLLNVSYTVLSTYMDAKITEEGAKLGCTGKVCQAGEAALKEDKDATIETVMAGKNLGTTAKAAVVAKKKAIIAKFTNFTSEENAVRAKYTNFKKEFTVAGFQENIKKAGDLLINTLVTKIAAAAEKKAEKMELPASAKVIETSYKGVQFEMINVKTFNINYIEWATQGIEIQAEGSSGAAYESQVSSTNVLTLGL